MVAPGASAAVVSRLVGRRFDGERALTVDQTNYSVVVAERFVVKWLQPPVPSPHPGVELLAHLTRLGFDQMPGFVGIDESDYVVHAVVTEFVPGALDGWDWYVDDVDEWLRGRRHFDDLMVSAQRIGALAADLHGALSGLQRSSVGIRTYHAEATESLHEALRSVGGEEGERLRAMEGAIRDALEPLRVDGQLVAHRIHGDLHVGQILRADGRLLVTDFDGNPLADVARRRLPQTPLRDLASLLQSIDHVGRIVVKRRHPDRQDDVDSFIERAVHAAAASYEARHAVDHDVLTALRVGIELHEYCYAAAHLQRWMYAPDTAMPALLAGL